jgi:RNA polymerase sigma-70 factor (ECF subfamily)
MRTETTSPSSLPTPPPPTDDPGEALLERIGRGDRPAMQALYARHHIRVYRFALRLIRDEALAEDITSEVFIGAWRQAHRFEGRSTVSTWLLAIARNMTIAAIRRRREVALEADVEIAGSDDPEATPQSKHRGEILRKCLTQLSREHREIIDLVYYHEKSAQEVAEIVGIPRNTVKTRMFYARRKLSELLAAAGVTAAFA